MLSITQYATAHGLSRAYIHRMIRRGRLHAIRIGHAWAIPTDARIAPLPKLAPANR